MSNLASKDLLDYLNFSEKLNENQEDTYLLMIEQKKEIISQLEDSLEEALSENAELKKSYLAYSKAYSETRSDLERMGNTHIPLTVAAVVLIFYGGLCYRLGVPVASVGFGILTLIGYVQGFVLNKD